MNNWHLILRNPYPLSAIGAGFAVFAVLMIWQYRAGARALPRRRRWFLILLHAAAAIVVSAIFLQPVIVFENPVEERESFVILVDDSRSMNLPLSDGKSRMDAVNETVGRNVLEQLDDIFDLKVISFSGEANELTDVPERFEIDEDGNSTDISEALRKASKSDPSGILILSDGCWNTGGDPRRLGASLAGRGTRINALAVEEGIHPDDISVRDVRCRKTVFLGDSLAVQLKVVQSGFEGRRVTLSLTDNGREILAKNMTLGAPLLAQSISLIVIPEVPGKHSYTAGIPVQEGEAVGDNNSVTFTVDVVEKQVKVLIVESEPRWEFRFLRNALERDPSATVKCILLRPGLGPAGGEGYLQQFPSNKKELGEYDVVVLGDMDVRDLAEHNLNDLSDFVKARGGGLIVIPGRHFGLFGYRGTVMEDILPIEIPVKSRDTGVFSRKAFPLRLTAVGREHLVTRLDSDLHESVRAWKNLTGGIWCCSAGDAKRGAKTLVEHPYLRNGWGSLPLLVVRQAGNGKVVFLGWDSLWRWRRGYGDRYHYRFWAQLVRWIVKKQFEGDDPFVKFACDRDVYDVGEEIFVEAYVLDKDYYPLDDTEVYLLIAKEGGERERILLHPDAKGWGMYRGRFHIREEGDYTVQAIVPYHGQEPRKTALSIHVRIPALESKSLLPDAALLRYFTEISGGRYVNASELAGLVTHLGEETRSRVRISEYSIWDSVYLFSLVAFILAVEWLLRKRWGLS